jgi:hypothetical protein
MGDPAGVYRRLVEANLNSVDHEFDSERGLQSV